MLTATEVAELLKIHPGTLARWRMEDAPEHPPYVKIGEQVRYRRADIERWIESRTRGGANGA